MSSKNVYLPSKPRYEILDGLRGVAALLILAFHIFENESHSTATQIINHGYMAVDFFFLLCCSSLAPTASGWPMRRLPGR